MILAVFKRYLCSNEEDLKKFRPERDLNFYLSDAGAVAYQLTWELVLMCILRLCKELGRVTDF